MEEALTLAAAARPGICGPPPATITNSMAAYTPTRRTHMANSFGTLMSKSPAAHSATPPANDGTLPARPAARVAQKLLASENNFAIQPQLHKRDNE